MTTTENTWMYFKIGKLYGYGIRTVYAPDLLTAMTIARRMFYNTTDALVCYGSELR